MSADWYVRQFGDREHFAIAISLGRDPHPIGDLAVDASWGGVSLWVRGRCLTRSVSSDGAVSEEVRWNLVSILRWLIEVGVRLVNEESFPEAARSDKVRDACDWFNTSETPLLTLTEAEEDDWFLRRSDWRNHHALRRAAADAALPNVMIRRLGDFVEVSWDNEAWGTPRAGLSFVEQRGTELLNARRAAADLRAALVDVTQTLAQRHESRDLTDLASAASKMSADDGDWQWLIHPQTARIITDELGVLRDRLNQHVNARSDGLYIPHTPETLLLRQARLISANELKDLLDATQAVPAEPMKAPIRELSRQTVASTTRPWKEGYERAIEVRDALGWGDEPAPDLHQWLKSNNIGITSRRLTSSIDLVVKRTDDHQALAVVNLQAGSRLRQEIGEATALGHILLDMIPVAVDGTWEHWPSAARARAFALMLMLPDDGVRDVLTGRSDLDASDVKRVMDRFKTGPYATTRHLKNRGFISSDERREEILAALVA